jgi:hypothetical protein
MTGRAAGEEVFAALLDRERVARVRVRLVALRSWYREVTYGSGRDRFKGRRCGGGAETAPPQHTCAKRTY